MSLLDLFKKKKNDTVKNSIEEALLKSNEKKIYMADLYVYSEDGFVRTEIVLVYNHNEQYINLINDQVYISKDEYRKSLNSSEVARTPQLGDKYLENFLLVPQRYLKDSIDYVINQNTIRRKGR
jgi:hypothetical protein